MKRKGDLWDIFISEENTEKAIQKSLKSKRGRDPVIEFLEDKEERTKEIWDMLNNETYPDHNYRPRTIYEGKKRTIFVIDYYPWRIIHHMVVNVIEPIFESGFIYHTYGCIRGRGQHKGSMKCLEFSSNYEYCLKMDIRKFYPSINRDILMQLIRRKIKDKRLLKVIETIIYSHDTGLPIGNLPSQLCGNIYMSKFDHWVKHELRFKNYIRYVDDFIFVSNSKEELKEVAEKVEKFLAEELKLTLSKKQLFKTKQGIDFLGYRHFKGYRLLRKRTATKLKRVVNHIDKAYEKGHKNIEQCMSTINSYVGWISKCNAHNLSESLQIEKVRKDLTREDFLKNKSTFITGEITKQFDLVDKEIVVNAFNFQKSKHKDIVKVQYYFEGEENKTYYFKSGSPALKEQLNKVHTVPFSCKIKAEGNYLYAA